MGLIQPEIIKFIKNHHVLNLATTVDQQPWCCSCFFSFKENIPAFIFTSDAATRHGSEMLQNKKVAASIVLETRIIGKIQGLQIAGIAELAEGILLDEARKSYLKRFPYAIVMETTFWLLKPEMMKLTDNRLGFGKKLIWNQKD